LQIYINDRAGYQQWLADHPEGYVLNSTRGPTSKTSTILHRAPCGHIAEPGRKYTSGPYYKVCGVERDPLLVWAGTQPRRLTFGRHCMP
jgi:hypothetical protein